MNRLEAIRVLKSWDRKGRYVFTRRELRKLFSLDTDRGFSESLNRLVKDGLLLRACYGIYVNPEAASFDSYVIEHIAKALRQGAYNYVSLESILSEYGLISQIPLDRLTVMTTGREGLYRTPYGTIEFTHTKRSFLKIIKDVKSINKRPLRIASKVAAWRDLKRVGRNTNMLNTDLHLQKKIYQ
jgi:predicted transcriptional regulator of viral defense system